MAAGGSKSKKTATIIDVARLAGVSQQTVSRVANGSNLVREATRAKVQAAMKELGYSPNRQARALRNGRSKMIGLVINYHRNNVLSDLLEGITSTAAKLGYGIVIVPAGEDIEEILLRQSGYIASLNLAVLIVFSDEDISESSADHVGHLPTVVLGSLRTFPNEWSFVDTQGSRISELAVEHLLGLGHKTVHHISGPLFSPAAVTRVEYWQRTLQAHGAPIPKPVESADWFPDDGYRAACQLLNRYPDCTAIYASDDAIASGAMAVCQERGLVVGRDVSVVGVDDVLGDFVPNNILTSVRCDFLEAGYCAMELLMKMLRDVTLRGSRAVISPELIVRESTARLKGA